MIGSLHPFSLSPLRAPLSDAGKEQQRTEQKDEFAARHVREADFRTFGQLCKVSGVQLSLVQNVICLACFAQQRRHVTSS